MTMPRFSISGLMALVLIVALNFGLGRAVGDPDLFGMPQSETLIIGGFPMGNVLAVGLAVLVIGGRERRPGLAGFLAFGLAAWLVFIACAMTWPHATHDSVRGLVEASGLRPGLGLASFVAVLFLIPQVGVALVGRRVGRLAEIRRRQPASKPFDYDFELPGVKATAP